MVNKYISSRIIIERIYDDYNIQSDDFVTKVPTWVLNSLREIGVRQSYITKNYELPFNHHRVCIPIEVDKVYGVIINGMEARMNFSNRLYNKESNGNTHMVVGFKGDVFKDDTNIIDLATVPKYNTETHSNVNPDSLIPYNDGTLSEVLLAKHINLHYWVSRPKSLVTYKINNGWIETSCEHGMCEILAGSIPYIYDYDLDQLFPIIPDDPYLIKCLTDYCLNMILMRGYKHSVLSLISNNEFINPALAYKNNKLAARNSCNTLSPSAKESLSKLLGRSII